MNSLGMKIAVALLSAAMIAYVCYQAYTAFYEPYETQTAAIGEYIQKVELNGFFLRDEIVLSAKRTDVVNYNYENAQKVPRSAVVASIYQNESDLHHLRRLELLRRHRDILEEAQDRESIDGMKLDLLNKQISASKLELVRYVDEGRLDELADTEERLMLEIGKFSIFVDPALSYEDTLSLINGQIASLEATLPVARGSITSEEAGYFANVVDGYEAVLVPELLEDLTVEGVEEILRDPQVRQLDNIGKLERDNRWYFVALITAREAELFTLPYENRQTVQLKFNSESVRQVTVSIEQLIVERDQENAVVVFSSTALDGDFAVMRFEKPQAILADYTGIILPKEAVRVSKVTDVEGNDITAKGVYVQIGDAVRFKRADVIYEDNYVLISRPNANDSYIANYDQIITKGKDLHETAG